MWRLNASMLQGSRRSDAALVRAQGVVGGMPWNAVGYATMWAQALGFSDMAAATLTALFWGGTALGNLIGGLVGDLLVKPLPDAGRQLTCQVSPSAPVTACRRQLHDTNCTATTAPL
jgi:hypothetical protein